MLPTNEEQNERWTEHFSDVLKQPIANFIFIFNEDEIPSLLGINMGEIRMSEVTTAVKNLFNNKTPGLKIPAKLLKKDR